jgi:amino-acid N-acetyltransferase
MWRDHTFVVALDGAVLMDDGFASVLVELAVLHNLGIRLVLGFGIGEPLAQRARARGATITDHRGEGPVDDTTLELAVDTAGTVQHRLVKALSQNQVRCAVPNAVRATERGVLKGVDHRWAGKVDRIDTDLLRSLLDQAIVPICGPIAFSRDGRSLRLNSDDLASALASALSASKLIFLTPHPGLTLKGSFQLNLSVDELEARLAAEPDALDPPIRSKALCAIRTIRTGVPRAHLLDARLPDALLTEIFSTVGVGSMIHANPYAEVRRARRADAGSIHRLTKAGVKDESLRPRTRAEIETGIEEYLVYEIDESIIGCCRLSPVPESEDAEVMSVYVHRAYGGRGIGRTLVEAAVEDARRHGHRSVYALSTQAAPFFAQICGFADVAPTDAPASLLRRSRDEGRHGRVLRRDV